MPPLRVRLTSLARIDFESIRQYSVETWGRDQAETYGRSLLRSANSLASFPERGQFAGRDYPSARRIVSGRHVIYYRILESEVEILRILHERMDASAHLE